MAMLGHERKHRTLTLKEKIVVLVRMDKGGFLKLNLYRIALLSGMETFLISLSFKAKASKNRAGIKSRSGDYQRLAM